MSTTEKAVEAILFRARQEFRESLRGLHREDVPFRMNGDGQRVNGDGNQKKEGRLPASGCTGIDSRLEVEAQQPAVLGEPKHKQS